MAFLLERRRTPSKISEKLDSWIEKSPGREVIGINVSGLLYNDPDAARTRFGLRAGYRETINGFVEQILKRSNARILLVPHVLTPTGHYESDIEACNSVAMKFCSDRVRSSSPALDASETKEVISRLSWFCGTRMHSMIAALSSGVPTAAISYSPKTAGVFRTCGQEAHVADPSVLSTEETIGGLIASWDRRGQAKRSLDAHLPAVLETAKQQTEQMLAAALGDLSTCSGESNHRMMQRR